jgi:hypothetical protein
MGSVNLAASAAARLIQTIRYFCNKGPQPDEMTKLSFIQRLYNPEERARVQNETLSDAYTKEEPLLVLFYIDGVDDLIKPNKYLSLKDKSNSAEPMLNDFRWVLNRLRFKRIFTIFLSSQAHGTEELSYVKLSPSAVIFPTLKLPNVPFTETPFDVFPAPVPLASLEIWMLYDPVFLSLFGRPL